MHKENGFHTLTDILPRCITYCILLSLLRFILTKLFMKVWLWRFDLVRVLVLIISLSLGFSYKIIEITL